MKLINELLDTLELEVRTMAYKVIIAAELKNYADKDTKVDEWAGYDECLTKVKKSIDGQKDHVALKALMAEAMSVYNRSSAGKDQWLTLCEICWDAYSTKK